MKCSNCGNEINMNDKFCRTCGAPITKERICNNCGNKVMCKYIFCMNCGTKLEPTNFNITDSFINGRIINESDTDKDISNSRQIGNLLRKMNMITKFEGEPNFAMANKLGNLIIYDNRIEFEQKLSLSFTELVNDLTNKKVETYYYNNCKSITTGIYMATYTTLVLVLKNGKKVSFCPSNPLSKDMKMIVDVIKHYI